MWCGSEESHERGTNKNKMSDGSANAPAHSNRWLYGRLQIRKQKGGRGGAGGTESLCVCPGVCGGGGARSECSESEGGGFTQYLAAADCLFHQGYLSRKLTLICGLIFPALLERVLCAKFTSLQTKVPHSVYFNARLLPFHLFI
jgi:hypothetical protein